MTISPRVFVDDSDVPYELFCFSHTIELLEQMVIIIIRFFFRYQMTSYGVMRLSGRKCCCCCCCVAMESFYKVLRLGVPHVSTTADRVTLKFSIIHITLKRY